MGRIAMVLVFALIATRAVAGGASRFDIATYALPGDWAREETDAAVRHTLVEGNKFCQINIFKPTASSGDVNTDFGTTWTATAASWKLTGEATSMTRPAIKGWSNKSGRGSFVQGATVQATVTVYTSGNLSVSVITIGTSASCEANLAKFFASLSLAAPASNAPTAAAPSPASPAPTTAGATSTTDDWTSVVQHDWVQVSKGGMRVYLYFVVPYDSNLFSGTGVVDRDYYWTNYIGKQFAIESTQYRDNGEVIGGLKPRYVEGWATDRTTRERRFVAMTLSISPNAAMLTVASAPDEASMRATFPNANDKNVSDLTAMSRYNRFPAGASDILGTWQDGATQVAQWYDARTGANVGATFVARTSSFVFAADGTYSSEHKGATGAAVGPMSTYQQNYKGTYKIDGWRVTATKRYKGRTDVFDAALQAVRGGWLLALTDSSRVNYVMVRTAR